MGHESFAELSESTLAQHEENIQGKDPDYCAYDGNLEYAESVKSGAMKDYPDKISVVSVDAHGPTSSNTNVPRTFINFLKSYIGSGILGLPYAFLQGGVIFSIFSLMILAAISNYCIRLLIAVSDELEWRHGKTFSFGAIGKALFGLKGRVIVDISLIFTQVGFCCVYVIFIGDNLHGIYDGIPSWAYVFMLIPFLVAVCWLRSFKILAYLSLIGQITMLIGLAIIMVFSMIAAVETKPLIKAINIPGIPVFFGMAVFTYEGIGLVIPMRRAMAEPHKYPMVLDIGYVFMTCLFIAFGTIGYCGYGATVNAGGITLNLPADSPWTLVTEVSLIIAIFATYPVQMFPVIAILEGLAFTKVRSLSKLKGFKLESARNVLRALLVIATSLIAISIPYFSLFVSLVGALGSSMLAFILPCVFYIKLFPNSPKYQKVINYLLVIFGVIASFIATSVTVYQLIIAVFHINAPTF